MRISDWSSDVCSSDLHAVVIGRRHRRVAVVGDHRAGLGNDLKAVEGLDEAEVLAGNGDWPRHLDEALLGQIEARKALARPVGVEIGRASWRVRVCQYA